VSITGYGRGEPQANWIAYGDDAGVAAGLSAILHQVTGQWLICGDAIADPLTGLHAALAGWASWLAGGGHLVELSLEQTVRHCITSTAPAGNNYRDRQARWISYLQEHRIVPRAPQRRSEAPASTP
jgi:crotonobetainyl-CoA:carnitine CoA-transferase CaiB-like acyl-CoA transferase